MFDKEYSFKGTHAEKVNKLTAKFDDKNQLFKRNSGCLYDGSYCRILISEKG